MPHPFLPEGVRFPFRDPEQEVNGDFRMCSTSVCHHPVIENSLEGPQMSKLLASVTTAAILVTTTAGMAEAAGLDLQGGGAPKPRVTRIQLGVQPPAGNVCPGNAKLTAWVFSNKPSTFPILVVASNGTVLGPFMVETVKGNNGVTMGTWSDTMLVGSSLDMKYHVVTPHSDVSSPWVPLHVEC